MERDYMVCVITWSEGILRERRLQPGCECNGDDWKWWEVCSACVKIDRGEGIVGEKLSRCKHGLDGSKIRSYIL